MKELHVVPSVLSATGWDPLWQKRYPYLTHLSLRNLKLTGVDTSNLRKSKKMGNLPELTFLDLSGSDIKGKLSKLFKSKWSELTHLYLKECVLDETDLNVLSNQWDRSSNLKSIALTLGDEVEITLLIPSPILNVTELWLDCVKHQYDYLVH